MLRYILAYLFLQVFTVFVNAQDTIPAENDSVQLHSVRKAAIFSAVLPGAGQVYNHLAMPKGQKKAYWKVPIIYAGLGATGYLALKNNALKNQYRTEFELRKNGSLPINFTEYDDDDLLTLYTTARGRRDLFIVGFGVVYLLNVLDAAVEAHFVNFDVGEDLSVSITPTYGYNTGVGVNLALKFH